MKIFSVFMMILLLATGLNVCPDDICGETENVEQCESSGEKQAPEDPCVPSCNCSFCALSMIVPGQVVYNLFFSFTSDGTVDLPESASRLVTGAIWQPPRNAVS